MNDKDYNAIFEIAAKATVSGCRTFWHTVRVCLKMADIPCQDWQTHEEKIAEILKERRKEYPF